MYMGYITALEETVKSVRTWSNKFKIAEDRKSIRQKAMKDFQKVFQTFEKKRTNPSQAPAKLEEVRKLEG